jgi:hypothetical protein
MADRHAGTGKRARLMHDIDVEAAHLVGGR